MAIDVVLINPSTGQSYIAGGATYNSGSLSGSCHQSGHFPRCQSSPSK